MSTSTTHRGILVGVDGSPPAKVAVDWAAREATMRNLPLTIVYVAPSALVPAVIPMPEGLAERVQEHGRAVLKEARSTAEEAARSNPIRIETEIVSAAVLPTLIDRSKDADMIVVGCRGLGALARRLLGSVSWGLVHHAHCPVAVIHDEDPMMPHPSKAPVVVGIDGSAASDRATEIAFEEASLRGVDLVAIHSWSDFAAFELPPGQWDEMKKDAEETLEKALQGWQTRCPQVNVRRIVTLDQPAHQLIEQSESAQLTVVGSHGRGGFAGMLLGSVSSTVVQSARMPVVVARQS
jgi:nucleotide-binding universal stress UspA family protein